MRQPPENSAQGRCWSACEKPRPARIAGGSGRRRMGADVGKPRLDLRDAMRVGRGLRLGQKRTALAIAGEHEVDQAIRAVGASCGSRPMRSACRPFEAAVLERDIGGDGAEQRRFAGAVAADKADTRAVRYLHGRLLDQQPPGNSQRNIARSTSIGWVWRHRAVRCNPAQEMRCAPSSDALPNRRADACRHRPGGRREASIECGASSPRPEGRDVRSRV